MNQKFIVIDGKTYKSVDEMPTDIRAKYEEAMRSLDKDRNGIPDSLEGLAKLQGSALNVMGSTKILVDGQMYDRLDQLPPEIRAKYEQAMGAMDANRNGIPDFVEGMFSMSVQTTNSATNSVPLSTGTSTSLPASPKPIPTASSIEPESSGGWVLALAGIALAGLCLVAAVAGVWYFFFR